MKENPLNEYQEFVAITDATRESGFTKRFRHYTAGLSAETGEVLGVLQRSVRYGSKINKDDIISELGDVLWYLTALADCYGCTIEDVMYKNMDKINTRQLKGRS